MRKTSLLLIYLYFLICPLEYIFNKLFVSSVKYIAILIAAMVFMYFVCNHSQRIHIGKVQICIILWAALETTSILWTSFYTNTNSRVVTYLMIAMLVLMLSIFPFDSNELTNVIRAYAIGCIILAVLLLFTGKMDGGYNSQGRLTIKVLNSYLDPNNLAAILLTGTFFCLSGIFKKEKLSPLPNIVFMVGFIIQVIAIFLTGSRGGLVALASGLLVYIFVKSKKKNRIFVVLTFLIGIIITYFLSMLLLPEELFNRLFDFANYSGGTGRIEHWIEALKQVMKRPIFGNGIVGYFSFFKSLYGGEFAMHNSFLAVLFEVGIVGFTFFMVPILLGIYSSLKTKSAMLVAIIVSNMAAAFFLDALHTRYLWNAIIIVVVWYEIQKRKEKETLSEKIKA